MQKTALVASLTTPPSDDGAELRELRGKVDFLEVRADLIGELDPAWLRDHFDGGLIYTLRSRAEGGKAENTLAGRQDRLVAAAKAHDLVDLEGERDLGKELLAQISVEQRLISWHGQTSGLSDLKSRFKHLARTPARFYKLIPTAQQAIDSLRVLTFLDALQREDVIAFCAGEVGTWTRLIAPRLGSPLVYGSWGGAAAAAGQPSIERLRQDYGLPDLRPVEFLCGVVGRPVGHSLSPRLHNNAYHALGLPGLYVPFHAESFADFWLEIAESNSLARLGFPLRGLSITAPFKDVALAISGASSPRAQHIGGANTLIFSDGVWEAETTDPEGVAGTLERSGVAVRRRRAAVVGCGGAGKAAAYGLQLAGAEVILVNRGLERGEKAARELALPFEPLDRFDPIACDIVVQATSLGHDESDPLPFDPTRLAPDAVVLDLVYGPAPTRLLREVMARGLRAIDGREVLLEQALGQFRLMTGQSLPAEMARRILELDPASVATPSKPS